MGCFRKLSAHVQFMIKSMLFKGKMHSDGEEQIRDRWGGKGGICNEKGEK